MPITRHQLVEYSAAEHAANAGAERLGAYCTDPLEGSSPDPLAAEAVDAMERHQAASARYRRAREEWWEQQKG